MIEITSDERYCITIKGHAEYDSKGLDIVCAAVSSLAFSLANKLEQDRNKLREADIRFEEAETVISCEPYKGYRRECKGAYEVFFAGVKHLSKVYPNNVRYIRQDRCI